MAATINLDDVGAHPSSTTSNGVSVRIGLYLPGIRFKDGFEVVVRIIHQNDRFNQAIQPKDFDLNWVQDSALDLWTEDIAITNIAGTHFGSEGVYLYRFQLWFAPAESNRQLITRWFTDPFARATDVGSLSAFTISSSSTTFTWNDASHKTPQLDDLVVYELQVEEFNDTFDGVMERLDYLQSLGVNCLELMPVSSVKLDFDWGYGPLHYFAPSARLGGCDGLKRLIDACHKAEMAVILDVVYQHVDSTFPYKLVYENIKNFSGAPQIENPMIGNDGNFGPQVDFSKKFAQDYFICSNRMWLDDYHVDGFRYDEVTDLYDGPTGTAYAKLAYDTYQYSLSISRFQQGVDTYSRIIQCAEALGNARTVLAKTYTSCAWQDDLLNRSKGMISYTFADAEFAHLLDPKFSGYPESVTVNTSSKTLVEMPVAPFQYLETHDHSQLIVSAGTTGDGFFPPGDRSNFYKLQPFAIALYTLQGVPMLWQGQEFADNYNLPDSGNARIGLRRDTHWEFFYDDIGSALQSLQGNKVIAYHRHIAANSTTTPPTPEQFVMVLLNFDDSPASITLPFPKAGTWTEMIDAQFTTRTLIVSAANADQSADVPSHYGHAFVWTAEILPQGTS